MSGMTLLRSKRGLMARVAARLGLSRAAVAMWREVPSKYLQAVARETGIPASDLRPDLAAAFSSPVEIEGSAPSVELDEAALDRELAANASEQKGRVPCCIAQAGFAVMSAAGWGTIWAAKAAIASVLG
ncbi:hypothetical protein [Roseomonas populi]|uniref:Helix-turn-helix domain-containing protein n=1 Tax=Roseomonas populi TaxID=3121582 RepID=A0ABT1X1Z1_9PROT|nr:hypothetical protein [Roseomonas pecuniae]MCR0981811.1 hypothetical protein [Roseomonas pecuniae]